MTWLREITSRQKRALFSASMGWMLDAMDIMLYSMVLAHLMKAFAMSKSTGGLLASLTLLASAAGGIFFGIFADRVGRVKALMASILIYSVFTGACGFSTAVWQLAIFRVLLGLGMGGEWATGAALVAETWPSRHRGKALGIMQSSWAVGYALAAGVTALVLPRFGWRAVFFVGVAPALLTLWIRRRVEEPEIWQAQRQTARETGERGRLAEIFRPPYLRNTLVTTLMNAGTMFAWWGLFTWIPSYLALPPEEGGWGMSVVKSATWIIIMQAGMWLGYVSFGFISDRIGRKTTYIIYLFSAAGLVTAYSAARSATALLVLGPFLAFFGTGYFSGFGAITAEIFPTRVRASAQGFTYNIGRGLSALAPFTIGALAKSHGLSFAFYLTAAFFLFSAAVAFALPETKGRELT
ncbi:MAG: MFS transporter [Candidatus Aminicenantes bacterium RBG_13_62_12]|nr:MAG: MFS transporter [Candidatus Aminicenantes bacterium RBG_13_62_12]